LRKIKLNNANLFLFTCPIWRIITRSINYKFILKLMMNGIVMNKSYQNVPCK
jgi:hypothetical protein